MTDLTALPALLARVEAATGPDRELDAAIMATFYTLEKRHIGCTCWTGCCPRGRHLDTVWIDPATDKWVSTAAHGFTSSLDATVALVEKMRPDWFFTVSNFSSVIDERPWADIASRKCINEETGYDTQDYLGRGNTPPLALLAALLRSMIEEEGR